VSRQTTLYKSASSSFWGALLLLQYFTYSLAAKDIPIGDVAALESALKSARPGDTLILSEGEWRDVKIVFKGQGTKAKPITMKAATPGKTVITGKSTLRIGGEHLVVEGLLFKDPDPGVSDMIQFRVDSDELAHHCRMTDCAVMGTLPGDNSQESRWVGLYGSGHRVDHCTFQGKSGKGPTFVVWLGDGSAGRHQIDHNYFGPREKLGKNGGETIRVGDSKTSMLTASCIIEKNLFEKCNGENECISNKSCGNTYRGNTFLEVSGTITLRHGNGCLVERNVFLGNEARGTGGIRIIGEDHIVRGNYLEKLTGDDGRAALSLMMGIPNSPAHRYFQVKRALVENNVIVDCKHSLLIGLSDDKNASLAPMETLFSGNIVVNPKYSVIEALCPLDGIAWKENHFLGKSLGIPIVHGIAMDDAKVTPLKPITRAEVGATWTSSASVQEANLTPRSSTSSVRELLDVPYVTNGHERQKLDLYLPDIPDEQPRPVLIRIHGGAWRHGDKSAQRSISNYVKQGYIAVAINYRFSQHATFPAQIEDCKAAVRWLRAHATEYGIDPDRIGVAGSSAGGHLAALLGTAGDTKIFDVGENLEYSSSVCAVVDNCGPTDLLQALQTPGYPSKWSAVTQLLGGPLDEKAAFASQANPINYISAADPPFLIVHGDADPIVPLDQSELLHVALKKSDVSSSFHVVKGGLHGGEAFQTPHYKNLLKDFLEKNVKGESTAP